MYISKAKVFVILLIIFFVIYKFQVEEVMNKDTSTFSLRRSISYNQEIPSFPNDYTTDEYAKIYLQEFLDALQKDVNSNISNYVEEDYYRNNIEKDKEAFIKNIKENLIMVNAHSNFQNIEFITEYINKDGHKTMAYGIMVMEKGLTYPKGYNSLKERNDEDKSKMMDIHVIEYSPYNFKILFPDKTIIVEDF